MCGYHFSVESEKVNLIETKSRKVVAKVWGLQELGRGWWKGTYFQLWDE